MVDPHDETWTRVCLSELHGDAYTSSLRAVYRYARRVTQIYQT